MESGRITKARHNNKNSWRAQLARLGTSQPAQVTVKSLDVGSRHRIQDLKEGLATDPQPTKSWAITE